MLTSVTQVHYIDDPELAYVMQRYRECHDFYHALCGLPVSVEYELALKVFEFANLGLPSAALSTAAVVRLNAAKRERFLSEYVPWALRCGSASQSMVTVYWEERWEQDLGELKKELGVWDPPPPKWRRPLSEAKEAAARRGQAAELGGQMS
jgi:ubiquinone biosynthesis protein COQ4